MSKKRFTDEEVAILAANPYTYKVTPSHLAFTAEFKRLYWEDYQNCIPPAEIFDKYGYDPEMLGRSRIIGFQQKIKQAAEKGLGFHEGYSPRGSKKVLSNDEEPYGQILRDMNHRIDYLEQEIDFLKKISSSKNTRK